MIKFLENILSKLAAESKTEPVDMIALKAGPLIKTVRSNESIDTFERMLEQPRKLSQNKILHQLKSFIKYIEKFKPANGADEKYGTACIFMVLKNNHLKIGCDLDYHLGFDSPSHCMHSISLSSEIDESFSKWLTEDNNWLTQKRMVALLKKYNSSLVATHFQTLMTSIEDVTADVKQHSTESNIGSSSSKSVYFKMLEEFSFNFRPYSSIPFVYEVRADLYAQLDDSGKLELKYSIRNMHKIHEQVADDVRLELEAIKGIEVF